MPGTVITTSPNISLLDSKVVGDICAGYFYIDATPSVFIGSGASNIKGIKVQITNPYGVIIKPYGSSYDINDPSASPIVTIYSKLIPKQAGTIQYGVYSVSLQLIDADDELYVVTKTINVCTYNADQNPCDDRLRLVASCKNGTLGVYLSEPPLFKGFYSQSRTVSIVVNYPTTSGHAATTSTFGNFSVQLFEGVYKVVVTVCALYNLTDNIFLKLPYSVTMEKNVKCLLDYTCIWPRIKQLWNNISEDCSEADNKKYTGIALEASLLIPTIQLANDAGEDASPYIAQLEALLGCVCTCDCSGSPIVNGTPSTDLAIEGCNVVKTTVGLTDVYTIDNVTYLITVDPDQSILTISNPSLDNCTSEQQLSFSIAAAYAGIKTQINSTEQYNFWAGIINQTLNPLTATCLGYNSGQWAALTFAQKMQAIIVEACQGGSCDAVIEDIVISKTGRAVTITWTVPSGSDAFAVQIFVDGILNGTVLSSLNEFNLTEAADGITHTYVLVPVCANGSGGTTVVGEFNELGCPTISPPVVSSNNVSGECPYDLTALLSTPPVGITVEWHTNYNTLSSTLVPDATTVSSGVYYAFARDVDGCYSTATVVTLICDAATSCTAPLSLYVEEISGDFRVTFNSANFPPPGNSYTVKRRLASAPDVDGSYTTIGTPTYNSFINKWVITDTTGIDNTLYVYKAISNCGGSPMTTPYTTYTFANISCPSLTLTPDYEYIGYSFVPVGGEVSKYEISIYDSTGTVLIHTDTKLPAFSNPTTGTMLYLTEDTTYRFQVTVYIGTYSVVCTQVVTATLSH